MADDFQYHDNQGHDEQHSLRGWIPVLIMLVCFPPVGVVMLIFKLFGLAGSERRSASQHPYDVRRDEARQWAQEAKSEARRATQEAKDEVGRATQEVHRATREVKDEVNRATREAFRATGDAFRATGATATRSKPAAGSAASKQKKRTMPPKRAAGGRGLTIWGAAIAATFGLGAAITFLEALSTGTLWYSLADIFGPFGFCGAGLVMLYYGLNKTKKSKRYRKYLALIGRRDSISVATLAQAMGVPLRRACDDLQDMLDAGLFPMGYLDMGSGRLILSDEGLQEEAPPEPAKEAPAAPRGMEREDQVLMDIRQVNDAISDEEMSRKIDRIGEITGKIFGYLRDKPDKEGQLRSFLSYYLPTTLKILRAYAQMEAQGIEGDNITAAKARIEGMMDKVVDGFEKQLDKLFQDDAMDITTDVAVLERMLDKDGLGSQTMQMGG